MDDLTALRIQMEWGADEALGALPLRRLRAPASVTPSLVAIPREPKDAGAATLLAPAPVLPIDAATLEDLRRAVTNFADCGLRATATTTVHPSGNPLARIVVIAEAPGSEDDRSGRAFSGPPGERFDQVMGTAGLGREQVLLTHLVPWRPPGNRAPSEAEIKLCLPFLVQLLTLVQPGHLVLLGQGPARAMLGTADPVRRLRGRWIDTALAGLERPIPALTLPSIDQWFRTPVSKRELWADVLLILQTLG